MPNLLVHGDDSRRIGFRDYFWRLLLTLFLFYVNIYQVVLFALLHEASKSLIEILRLSGLNWFELAWTFPYFYIDLIVIFPSSHITVKTIKSL